MTADPKNQLELEVETPSECKRGKKHAIGCDCFHFWLVKKVARDFHKEAISAGKSTRGGDTDRTPLSGHYWAARNRSPKVTVEKNEKLNLKLGEHLHQVATASFWPSQREFSHSCHLY